MWKLWHGDNHLIADDKITWKKDCPTFNMIIDAIRDYFKMDIKATRLNWYIKFIKENIYIIYNIFN